MTLKIAGASFGKLKAIKPTAKRYNGSIIWECQCRCGKKCRVPAARLIARSVKSCGCATTSKVKAGQKGGRGNEAVGRNKLLLAMHRQGHSAVDIGRKMKLSTSRVFAIIGREKRRNGSH